MKDKNIAITITRFITIVILYYIAGTKSLFLYATTLSLYNIYLSCFSHITIKDSFTKINCEYSKFNILKAIVISMGIIGLLFVLLSIVISDSINIFLNLEHTFWPYLIMSLSVLTEPLIKIFCEYIELHNKPKLSNTLLNTYHILDSISFLIIGILTLRIIKMPIYIAISLLYLSKILSFIIISILVHMTIKNTNIISEDNQNEAHPISYKNEIKKILKNNSSKSIISIVKHSYYYISIIILYMVLSTRYSYNISTVEKEITFVYLYGLTIVNFVVDLTIAFIKSAYKKLNIINYISKTFNKMLTISIVLCITSSLICKLMFGNPFGSVYLMMLSFLSIFIALFNITFEYIKNKKITYISLIAGIILKIILIIPLINAFYRMGYNLIYGDIISAIISMFVSVIINYIYIKNNNPKGSTLEQILKIMYENILLCIILVILQFIIPITTDSYIKSVILLIIYISISVIFINLKKKKRG